MQEAIELIYDNIVSRERVVNGIVEPMHDSEKVLHASKSKRKAASKGRRWGGTDLWGQKNNTTPG